MVNRYRLKFEKKDKMKFIGHLDLMKLFQKIIRRTDINIEYSKGFNPHQKMSFALPLSLGHETVGDYMEIELVEQMNPEDIKNKINNLMPDGVRIIDCFLTTEKNSASLLSAALYEVVFSGEASSGKGFLDSIEIGFQFNESKNKLLSENEVMVEKKTKSGISLVDIRKDIFSINVKADENESNAIIKIEMMIAAGSKQNLKPELVTQYILDRQDKEHTGKVKYIRKDMFKEENNIFISLGDKNDKKLGDEE